ncbi:MAG: hypothetical protein IID46_11670 [Planctomycetes bacterium]|nr:hypothetical protein [Planctomycetota bacterium]
MSRTLWRRLHDAVLDFLRGRDDAVLYGAQAVNAYVDEPRMTQDVDILSPRAAELVQEIREFIQAERQRQFEPLGRTWFPKKSFQKTKMPAFSARAASTYRPALTDTQSRTPATPL